MRKNHTMIRLLLAAMLLVCTTGGAFAGAEPQSAETMSYEELLRYSEDLFGFEDTRYYPYLPTFLDPVNYFGSLSMTGGVKDDTFYAVYNAKSEEQLALYLGYLEYWGYICEPADSDLPGVKAWRLTSTESNHEGRPLMQTVDVYHVAEHELLAVAYSYLDAWLYDEWLARPAWNIYDHFEPGMLPCILPLNDDVTITVEEILLTDLLFVTAEGELSLDPYDAAMLQNRDLQITSLKVGNTPIHQHVLHIEPDNYNSDLQMMCVRVSYSYGAREELLPSLRAALAKADEDKYGLADCTDVPMLILTQSKEDPRLFSIAEEGESEDIWIVFPPGVYKAWDAYRLYFCLRDENAPWIGDLRDWRYINFEITPKGFR